MRYECVETGYGSPCWEWKLARNCDGYGMAYDGRRVTVAHRVEYERHGRRIPQGLTLDHLCRVKACVNPDHSEPVSVQENLRRSALMKLSDVEVQQIRASHEPQHVVATRHKISQSHVSRIKAWKARRGG